MTRQLQLALLLSLCSLTAWNESGAQTITAFSADEVAAPDDVSLLGTGFADGATSAFGFKFKVRLIEVDTGKVYKPKYKGANDSKINVRLRKMPAGEYSVHVKRNGADEFQAPGTLTVRAPEVMNVGNPLGFACGRSTLTGRFLGLLPGKVRVGGKRAKVIGWQPIHEIDGEPVTATHRATFVVPRGLGPGPHDVELKSLAGTDVLEAALEVQSTELPCRLSGSKAQMAARLDAEGLPKKLRSKPPLLVGWTDQSLDDAETAAQAEPFVFSETELAAQLEGALTPALAGAQDATTILGVARKGKAVRLLALVMPGWNPQPGDLLVDDDALALEPLVVLIDFRIQNKQLVEIASWGGAATEVQLANQASLSQLSGGSLHVRFVAEELELVSGEGAATISVPEALILNARHVNL